LVMVTVMVNVMVMLVVRLSRRAMQPHIAVKKSARQHRVAACDCANCARTIERSACDKSTHARGHASMHACKQACMGDTADYRKQALGHWAFGAGPRQHLAGQKPWMAPRPS